MTGLCECGCGQPTKLIYQTNTAIGHVKGMPHRFIKGHHQRGKFHQNWKGGRTVVAGGYISVRFPGHPKAHKTHVYEHVLIAERALGRVIPDGVEIHHVNEDKGDNRGCNLVICENRRYHGLLHKRMEAYRATGNPNSLKCAHCGVWGLPPEIQTRVRYNFHPECKRQSRRKYGR